MTVLDINIGGQSFKRSVPFDQQNLARDIEEEINAHLRAYQVQFPRKDMRELLAMLIYQYASGFKELSSRYEEALKLAETCCEEIDNIMI